MDNEKMGRFISELRKANHMTQKELAAKLNVTDKAVSKWERGLSCPDIALLSPLADIFGITSGELLNGEKRETPLANDDTSVDNALQYADKAVKSKTKFIQGICAVSFSGLLAIGTAVCAICNLAISGNFTWSLYPISSMVFAWLVFFPVIKYWDKGIWGTLVMLSILIIPYFYVLNSLVKTSDLLLPIAFSISVVSVIFLWIVFALFKILGKRKLMAAGISVVLTIPLSIIITFILSRIISEPPIDVWDFLSFSIIGIVAIVIFAADYRIHGKRS